MFGWLGKIFGTAKAADRFVGELSKGIDALDYTSEEKAHDKQASIQAARQAIIDFQTATSGQNLARTFLAVMIGTIWAGSLILQNGAVIYAIFTSNAVLADELQQASKLLDSNLDGVHQFFAVILAFYFGEPHIKSIASVISSKKGK